jgi:ATPase subunit of ABC transporter with duplicated ATPase domains
MSTTSNETIVRFDNATFDFGPQKHILDEVDFSVRRGMKMTFMGQNGAGKSTIFKMITGELSPRYGKIHVDKTLTVAMARQVMAPEDKILTVRDFFAKHLGERPYNIDALIGNVLAVVHLAAPLDRIVSSFSGGQQARLLLAGALIRNPDLLLLDEPTNNLDREGIDHLTDFLTEYPKSVLVISHDADFLNAFTDGVFYLDVHTHKVEQYLGNYHDVVEEISKRIERENMKNARLMKEAQANKEQAEVFAHKGGKLRLVAKKMREKAEELEDSVVDVRREDRTIREFEIPMQEGVGGEILRLESVRIIRDHTPTDVPTEVSVRRGRHVLVEGPNGIGKSTLLESIVNGTAAGMKLGEGVKIGYYRQDFSNMNFEHTVRDSLIEACEDQMPEQQLRSMASGFLITGEVMKTKIGHLSEGQKALVSFARLVLQRPGLLILDEPTNHVNFRHIPIIAEALDKFEGAMILVSHVQEFVWQIRIDDYLDLGDIADKKL